MPCSTYGSDASNYRPPQHTGHARGLPIAAALTAEIPADLQALWQRILQAVQQHVPATDFATWLRSCAPLDPDAATGVVGVGNSFVRDHVAQDYAADLITKVARS